MGYIYFQIGLILCLVLLLGLMAYGDRHATREREAEDKEKLQRELE